MNATEKLILKTYEASSALRNTKDAQIRKALKMLADSIEKNKNAILNANRKDVMRQNASDPRTDRLLLNEQRITNIATSIRKISTLPNPSGKMIEKKKEQYGLWWATRW